jgi:transposase
MMNISALGIDIAKNVFQLHGVNKEGKITLQKKLSRDKLVKFVSQLPVCKIGMESCGGSNYWARKFQRFGHEVKLMSPQFVKPYVKSNKNDTQDAEAICEALTRPNTWIQPISATALFPVKNIVSFRQICCDRHKIL